MTPIVPLRQQVAGRLHVELMRVSGAVPERLSGGDDSSENSSESSCYEVMDTNGEVVHMAKRLTCRVRAAPLVRTPATSGTRMFPLKYTLLSSSIMHILQYIIKSKVLTYLLSSGVPGDVFCLCHFLFFVPRN